MSAWIKSHQSLQRHPKTRRVVRALGVSLPEVIGLLHCLWWWALDYAPKGDLAGFSNSDIAEAAMWVGDPDTFVEALVTAGGEGRQGFIEVTESGMVLHDWDDYAGGLLISRENNARRQQAYRDRHKSGNTEGKQARNDVPDVMSPSHNNNVTVTSQQRNGLEKRREEREDSRSS